MPLALICLLAVCATPAIAETPFCGADAVARAGALLKLHWNSDGVVLADQPGPPLDTGEAQAWSVDEAAAMAGTVRAPAGDGAFDVLEVNGAVYKATYRMRFIYAQIPDACVLMGQEILEVADPY